MNLGVDQMAAERPREKEPELVFDADQQRAIDAALAGKNVFLTGPGGVGKSLLLREIIKRLRRSGKSVGVSASTGVAAINIGGTTIHSLLGTGLAGNASRALDMATPERLTDVWDRIGHLDTIVVDEGSMLTGDYFNMMQEWLTLVKSVPPGVYRPWGGYQLIVCADFLQLPPVIRDVAVTHQYAFQSSAWQNGDLVPVYLRRVYRQSDPAFLQHLHSVRMGNVTKATLDYFNARVLAKLPEGAEPIRLFAHNAAADDVNDAALSALPGKPFSFDALLSGHPSWQDAIVKNAPCERVLTLKLGARVIFIRNNWQQKYYNGMRGVVVDVSDGSIGVRADNGSVFRAQLETWEMHDAKGDLLASMTQFPLRLAWALTIHKSQGMTLDCVEADLSKCFDKGQVYVGLSRVRTYEGLRLLARLSALSMRASREAVEFYKGLESATASTR